MTPFGGGPSLNSPMSTYTTRSIGTPPAQDQNLIFEFPPELVTADSYDSSHDLNSNKYAMVPFYKPCSLQERDIPVSVVTRASILSQSNSTPTSTASGASSHSSFSSDLLPPPSGTDAKQKNENFLFQVPPSLNPMGSDDIHPNKKKMKKRRVRRMAGGAVGGAVVGGLVLGPVGAVIGGVGAAYATKKICKLAERRAQRRFEQTNFQQAATCSVAAQAGAFA